MWDDCVSSVIPSPLATPLNGRYFGVEGVGFRARASSYLNEESAQYKLVLYGVGCGESLMGRGDSHVACRADATRTRGAQVALQQYCAASSLALHRNQKKKRSQTLEHKPYTVTLLAPQPSATPHPKR